MHIRKSFPPELENRAFTLSTAAAFGLTRRVLQGKGFRKIHRGVYCYAHAELTLALLIEAARLALPPDAAISHTTALQWLGVGLGPTGPLHFSTNSSSQTVLNGVVLHRRQGTLSPREADGVPTLGPDRTFVDCCTILGAVDLIRAGDWLVRLGLTTPLRLSEYAHARHLDGVTKARRVVGHVRARVDSVAETDVRLMIRFGRLPEPDVNVDIFDDNGAFLARGDLVYRKYRIIVEYDGWQHERDAHQRQKDHLRRERLEAAGWRLIVITVADLRNPASIVTRVHTVLVKAGYHGADPILNDSWRRWFLRDL